MIFRLMMVMSLLWLAACSGEPTASRDDGAHEAQMFKWRMVTTWPKNLPGVGTAPVAMAKKIKQMSNGRLDIRVYGAGEIVPALEVFDAVSQGTVQMGHGAAYYWKGKVPIAQLFTTMPFGLTAQEMNAWLLHGGGLELWRELYAPFNLRPYPGGNTGVQMAGWFNKEINSLGDIRGLKMRIPGLGGEVFERAGVTVVTLPGGEIFTSMETGVIDATEWIGPYNDLAFGLHQVAEYYYYPGWQEPGPNLEITVNSQAYATLPDDLQAILDAAIFAANGDLLAEYTARNNTALRELIDEHHVKVRRLPDSVLAELQRRSVEVVDGIVDEAPSSQRMISQRIFDSYQTFYDKVVEYHEISERAYINARAGEPTGSVK